MFKFKNNLEIFFSKYMLYDCIKIRFNNWLISNNLLFLINSFILEVSEKKFNLEILRCSFFRATVCHVSCLIKIS